LSFESFARRWGIPEHQLIHIHAQDQEIDSRNPISGSVFIKDPESDGIGSYSNNLIKNDMNVDVKGIDTNIERILRILSGRHSGDSSPREKVLKPNKSSKVFVYLTGHGGDHFMKIRDWKDLQAEDLAVAFDTLKYNYGFDELLWLGDSCEIATIQEFFYTPGIHSIGSSEKDQNAWSHNHTSYLMNSLTDIWTNNAHDLLSKIEDPCDDKSVPSIDRFHKILKKRSREMNLQDAVYSQTDGTRIETEAKLTPFLSSCVNQSENVLRLSNAPQLKKYKSWEVPNPVPNQIGLQKNDIKIVPGRFTSIDRLSMREPLYESFIERSSERRDQIMADLMDTVPMRFPDEHEAIRKAKSNPELGLVLGYEGLLEKRWSSTLKVLLFGIKCAAVSLLIVYISVSTTIGWISNT